MEALGEVKQTLFRIWENYLVTLRKYIGYQKLNFPGTGKNILGTVLLIRLLILTIQTMLMNLMVYWKHIDVKSDYIENDLGEI